MFTIIIQICQPELKKGRINEKFQLNNKWAKGIVDLSGILDIYKNQAI